jgi:hypothetical protein
MVISSYIKNRKAKIENKSKKEDGDEMQKGTLLLINTRA